MLPTNTEYETNYLVPGNVPRALMRQKYQKKVSQGVQHSLLNAIMF